MNFKRNETAQKLRGGYYTPADLAGFLARWISEIGPTSILEPSCGDGAFLGAIAAMTQSKDAHVTAFELDAEEAAKARGRAKREGLSHATVYSEDFLGWAIRHWHDEGTRFDAVVGNPPFVRYQYLPESFQARAESIFRILGLAFTKHTNAWVPFILASIALLRPGGRMAMVVPAEIFHVTHAQSLRSFLGKECRRVVVIDPEELWFSETLQGAVILMAEKRLSRSDTCEGLGVYPTAGRHFLKMSPSRVFDAPVPINGKTVKGKWTRALLDVRTRALLDSLEEHRDVHRFEAIADVDVGIVTGANKFFLVSDETVEQYELADWAHPMFGRSEHCPGLIYDSRQHRANAKQGLPTNFLWFEEGSKRLSRAARSYISLGESQNLHTRYKCRTRSPWYTVPSVYSTEVGMLKRSHNTPRLILNRLGAFTTDTAYRVRPITLEPKTLVGLFVNPLTALSAELEGRHYGGGVLELTPSEIEKLLVPVPKRARIDISALDKSVREKSSEEVLDTHGSQLLSLLGLEKSGRELLLHGWMKLRDRRRRIPSDSGVDELVDL